MLTHKFWFLLLLGTVLASPPWEVRGTVFAPDGTPLPYTVILKQPGSSWLLADEAGQFQIEAGPGDSLIFQRYGYRTRVEPAVHSRFLKIMLIPEPLELDSVTVTAPATTEPVRTESYTRFTDKTPLNLQQIPALLYRNYGGPGGVLTVSMEGGLSRHTKILLDGIDLSSPQNGETDLSQIPPFLMDRYSLSRTPVLSFGSGAIDGSINIQSAANGNKFNLIRGTYGYKSQSGQVELQRGRWKTMVWLGQTASEGNYRFQYQGKQQARNNNDFSQIFWGGKATGIFNSRRFIALQVLHSGQDRGIPGVVQSSNPDSRRKDTLELFQLKSGWIFTKGTLTTAFTQRNSHEQYLDPRISVDSRHRLYVRQFKTRWEGPVSPTIRLAHIAEIKQEEIQSTDAGNHRRTQRGFTTLATYQPSLNYRLFSGFRLDQDPQHYRAFTWQSQLEGAISEHFHFTVNFGKGFKYPSFNDLYWSPGGNPELNAETTFFQQFLLRYTYGGKQSWDVRVSRKASRDLIQWIPKGAMWQPENVARALRWTLTLHWQGAPLEDRIAYAVYVSYFYTRDEVRHKSLLYVPAITGNFHLTLKTGKTALIAQFSYTGERLTAYDWPWDRTLSAYSQISGGIECQPFVKEPRFKASLWMENILNAAYQTVQGYPEPGRQVRISITYQSP